MDCPAPGLRLESITPPWQEIMRIWRTLRPVDRFFIRGFTGDLRPTLANQGIFVPNPFTVIRSQLSTLLGIPVQEVHHELRQGWDHGIKIAWLLDWTLLRALTPSTGSYQRDACHRFLLLIFGTLLFPHAPNLIDGAIAQVVLQAVGGHSYMEALLAETVRSLDYVREVRRGRMRGSLHLLQVWLLAHIRPFCSSHPFSYITDECSLIASLVLVFPPPVPSFSEWRHFLHELTPARFLWVARWNPGGSMITRCLGIVGAPLLSHLGSTLMFPGRHHTTPLLPRAPHRRRASTLRHISIRGSVLLKGLDVPTAALDYLDPTSRTYNRPGSHSTSLGSFSTTPVACPATYDPRGHTTGVFRRSLCTSLTGGIFKHAPSIIRGTPSTSLAISSADLIYLRRPRPTVDPTSWIPLTQIPKSVDALARPTTHASTVYPFTIPLPSPSAPTAFPFPPATFLTSDQALSMPPPIPMPVPTPIYTAPSPMVFPASTTFALTHITESFPFPTPQPNINLPYQGLPPLNIPLPESGTPMHAAPTTPPTNFLPEAETEQERRMKRIKETIRTLQASEARPDINYGDYNLFPGMRLPPKVKVPEFKTHESTTDPRHHLRHYRGKMLQYWNYEEFVIHSFQDSPTRSALDWFMSLRAEDIPIWADLSRKFINQYQYCAETPPTLLELSMKEMTQGQKFEEYAIKWRAQAAKHIPSINEVQQFQLFHSTLREVYYSHLLAHTSSFSDLIEARKKLDLGIRLGRMEGPAGKGEESSKKASEARTSSSGRREKEVSVNAVNPMHPTSQQYSVNFTPAPPVVPTYTPQAPQYRPQPPAQPIYYLALPSLLPLVASSPVVHHYTPAPFQAPHICALKEDDNEHDDPSHFVIEYIPTKATVGFTKLDTSPTPFVIDVPTREPYLDNKVPWTYEGDVGSLEHSFSVMGVTRSGRVYETPEVVSKGKAPVATIGAMPDVAPIPLSAPHFGPPASYTRIPDQNPGYYSLLDNRRRTCGHGDMNDKRKQGPLGAVRLLGIPEAFGLSFP
ncbi:hypothetical protein CRG98_000154 [Punica granatum]|uniref:DUF7745 domain-containing protein n=1 Tax=Punica granatum TaxID=22663 RepID=A0A2I0LFM7_PUNGR|nr:hypothetical protein CRG98_000154 [Punica granatum]